MRGFAPEFLMIVLDLNPSLSVGGTFQFPLSPGSLFVCELPESRLGGEEISNLNVLVWFMEKQLRPYIFVPSPNPSNEPWLCTYSGRGCCAPLRSLTHTLQREKGERGRLRARGAARGSFNGLNFAAKPQTAFSRRLLLGEGERDAD